MSSTEPHIVFNDEDEYSPETVDPMTVAQYTEISDSDEQIAYEAAFGTTVNSSDYMSQYVKHNRQNNQPTPSHLRCGTDVLLSPTDIKQCTENQDKRANINNLTLDNNISTMANVGTQNNDFLCKPTPSPGTIEKNISGESLGTLAAMTQGTTTSLHSHSTQISLQNHFFFL